MHKILILFILFLITGCDIEYIDNHKYKVGMTCEIVEEKVVIKYVYRFIYNDYISYDVIYPTGRQIQVYEPMLKNCKE